MRVEKAWWLAKQFYGQDFALLHHCENVAWMARHVAMFTPDVYSVKMVNQAYCGGLLHDVGKPFSTIDHHCEVGRVLLERYDKASATVAMYHHQYPKGAWQVEFKPIKNRELELVAQLVALTDKVEAAMTRGGEDPLDAIKNWGKAYPYNTKTVETFFDMMVNWDKKTYLNGATVTNIRYEVKP